MESWKRPCGRPATGRSQESLEIEKLGRSICYGSKSRVWITKRTHHTWKVVKGMSLFNSDLILIFLTTRGLAPRNDVLTNCKAARSEPAEEMIKKLKKIMSCIFVFHAYRICQLVQKLRGGTKTQPC